MKGFRPVVLTNKCKKYHFLKNYVTSEGVVFYSVLYYQQLTIVRYQIHFYANNYLSIYQ